MPQPRILLVFGAFAREGALKAVTDWSRAVVLEVDAFLPSPQREQCAAIVTVPPLLPEAEAMRLQNRAEDLLDEFLDERAPQSGLETSRPFRASCLSIEAWRIVIPHIVCLEYASRALEHGPFAEIIVAPGAGVSLQAFKQLAGALGAPLRVLPHDRQKPPLLWMLKRRWQRARLKAQAAPPPPPRLPARTRPGQLWCADPRLESIVARDDREGRWVAGPRFTEPAASEVEALRQLYLAWWEQWWADWKKSHPDEDALSPRHILGDLGRWFSRERYPLHACHLQQARRIIAEEKPARVLIGSMRGRREFLWGLAARELGIPSVVYTVDCSIYPRLVFRPDLVLCDDARQFEVATQEAKLPAHQVIQVSSHRRPPARSAAQAHTRAARPRLLLADTYYSGMVASSSPLLSAWAYQRVIEAARSLPGHDFFIKLHPVRERPDPVFHLSGQHHLHLWQRERNIRSLKPPPNVAILAPEERLSDWLPGMDVLLNIQSYAGLEAFALRIPVIYVQPWDEEGLYPRMNAMGVMQVAVDTPSLVRLIRLNLEDPGHCQRQLALQEGYLDYFYWEGRPPCAQAAALSAAP